MNKMKYFLFFLSLITLGCIEQNPNEKMEAVILDRDNKRKAPVRSESDVLHTVYVPIYSSIYNGSKNEKVMLTATLSIRNTSEKDSMYLSRVSYFNTAGDFVRNYVQHPIYLKPLESLEYVIEQNDNSGGSGANFMIDWYSDKPLKPLFQGVMIGGLASRTFSFTTIGLEVN